MHRSISIHISKNCFPSNFDFWHWARLQTKLVYYKNKLVFFTRVFVEALNTGEVSLVPFSQLGNLFNKTMFVVLTWKSLTLLPLFRRQTMKLQKAERENNSWCSNLLEALPSLIESRGFKNRILWSVQLLSIKSHFLFFTKQQNRWTVSSGLSNKMTTFMLRFGYNKSTAIKGTNAWQNEHYC